MELIFFLDLPLPHMINAQLVNSTTLRGYLKEGNWQPSPLFLPGESHGQRSLVGCGPWGSKESDMAEAN